MNTYQHNQKWSKNPADKKIFGVCSGLARRFELPVWATRIVSVILLIQLPVLIGAGYLIAYFCLDERAS